MSMRATLIGAVASVGIASGTIAFGAQAEEYAVYESESSFEDVMDALKLAIQERGMYINNVMHMGEMLERTGKDLGMEEPIYTQADSIEFCSAVLSRKMTLENPSPHRQLPVHRRGLYAAQPTGRHLRRAPRHPRQRDR